MVLVTSGQNLGIANTPHPMFCHDTGQDWTFLYFRHSSHSKSLFSSKKQFCPRLHFWLLKGSSDKTPLSLPYPRHSQVQSWVILLAILSWLSRIHLQTVWFSNPRNLPPGHTRLCHFPSVCLIVF